MRSENSSNRIFIIVIALLLVANIATLAMLASKKTLVPEERKSYMRAYLKNEVGFSDKQLQDFDTIKTAHRIEVKSIYEQIRNHRQTNLIAIGTSAFSDSSINMAAVSAAEEQKILELNLLLHIKDIRDLCTPAQRVVFDTGFYKVMARVAADKAAAEAKKK